MHIYFYFQDVKIIGYVLALLSCHSESKAYLQNGVKTLSLEEIIPLRGEFFPDRLDVQWISGTYLFF